jgi:hypothetical protein
MSTRDTLPPGTATTDAVLSMILASTGRTLDEEQWRMVARRKGIRRFSGTRYVERKDASGRSVSVMQLPIVCWSVADLRKHLRWIGRCDERLLEAADLSEIDEIPDVREIYRRAAMLRGLRAMAGDMRDEDEPAAWSAPEVWVGE